MGRPKKNETELLLRLTMEYFENETGGDCSKLKYTKLAEYAKKNGYEIEERHFRREPVVQEKIEEIKRLDESKHKELELVAYRNLDVNELISKSHSAAELKNKILGLDNYWKEVYDKSLRLEQENKKLKAKPNYEKHIRDLEAKYVRTTEELKEKDRIINALEKEITYLKSCLRQYLYPTIAEMILKGEGYTKKTEAENVDVKNVTGLIEGIYPQKFNGVIAEKKENVSKISKLLEEMEKEVNNP